MPSQYAFTVMSFRRKPELDKLYTQGIRPAVTGLGIECRRVDESHHIDPITDAISAGIKGSYFVIAELSDQRPNCYYECGFARALDKKVIMLIKRGQSIAFDVQNFPFIEYANPRDLQHQLRERILGAILTTEGRTNEDEPHRGCFGRLALRNGRLLTATIAPADDDEDYECDVRLEVRGVPKARPLTGQIVFYLHPSHDPEVSKAKVKNGIAAIEIECDDPFVVGAKLDDGTKLELDLRAIPGGTPDFYDE